MNANLLPPLPGQQPVLKPVKPGADTSKKNRIDTVRKELQLKSASRRQHKVPAFPTYLAAQTELKEDE
jgi:hypothetical protein